MQNLCRGKKNAKFLFAVAVGGLILIYLKFDHLKSINADHDGITTSYKDKMQVPLTRMTENVLNTSNKGRTRTSKKEQFSVTSTAPSKVRKSKQKVYTNPDEYPEYFKRREERLTPLDFNFLLTSDVCEEGPTHLLIMVLSMASHRDYRNAVRETWGGVNHNNSWGGTALSKTVRLVFLFGITANESETASLKKEAAETHDIVLADFKEAYFNLTYKVLMGFKWVKQYCSGAEFVMKNDEDSVVHIPWLLERLALPEWNTKIIGPYFTNQMRYSSGKHAVSIDSYPFNKYPPHVKGNVYVMSRNMSLQILELAEYMPYVNVEDVHITGILPKVLGYKHMGISRREYNPSRRPGVCDLVKRRTFAGLSVSASYARDIWKRVLEPKSCK